jgi:TfoX/Sxy family transcriptional regulator of competence genes
MFGEFGLYSHGVFFGLICDDRLFIKPTEAGRTFIGDVAEAPAYPGARPSLLIEDRVEDGPWLSELVRITARELSATNKKRS